jgi:hypothetical protein
MHMRGRVRPGSTQRVAVRKLLLQQVQRQQRSDVQPRKLKLKAKLKAVRHILASSAFSMGFTGSTCTALPRPWLGGGISHTVTSPR